MKSQIQNRKDNRPNSAVLLANYQIQSLCNCLEQTSSP